MMPPVVSNDPPPGGPFVFVAPCPACGAEVWTYRRLHGLSKIGPHKLGPRSKPWTRREWCEGGGSEVRHA